MCTQPQGQQQVQGQQQAQLQQAEEEVNGQLNGQREPRQPAPSASSGAAWQWWKFDDRSVSALRSYTALEEQGSEGYLLFFNCVGSCGA